MNKRVSFTLLIALVFFYNFSSAQNREATMSFDKEIHKFGTIEEKDGDAGYKFVFTNTGAESIIITDVQSSCGCTTPTWTTKPVAPGETGFVKAVYHPKNRPGVFNKSITVYSNAVNSPVKLRIQGIVKAKPKKIADDYKYLMDKIRLKKNNIHYSNMFNDEKKTQSIEIINVSNMEVTVSLTSKRAKPKHIKFTAKPAKLSPGEKGKLIVEYDASKKNDWDYVRDRLYIDLNGEYNPRHTIRISGYIKERFTEDDLKNPPNIEFVGSKTFDFGTLKQGEKAGHKFLFKNTGKSDLIIRKVRSSCGCTATAADEKIIKPGEVSFIRAEFNSAHKSGKQNKIITVITNIPGKTKNKENARQILRVTGEVKINH